MLSAIMARHTTAERENIRNIVQELYLLNGKPAEIMQFLAEKHGFHLKIRQVAAYISEVRAAVMVSAKFDRDEELGKCLNRLGDLYRKCMNAKKYQTALQVQREISETLGLKAPERKELEMGETLHDWLKGAAKDWPADGAPNGGQSDGGANPSTVSETNH